MQLRLTIGITGQVCNYLRVVHEDWYIDAPEFVIKNWLRLEEVEVA